MESPDFPQKATVLVVDDTPDNLSLMTGLLKDTYRVKVANNGERALKIVRGDAPPDLILLDIMMPGLDGYDVCEQLKADPATRDIPVIFLTAMTAVEDEKKGLEMGAVDYITKPISPPIVLARVATHLEIKAAADFLKDKNAFLESGGRPAHARDLGDPGRHHHWRWPRSPRRATTTPATTSGARSTTSRRWPSSCRTTRASGYFLTEPTIELLFKSAPLHDIGKVGIPDRILLKPGRFTPEEFEIMKTHTTLGRDAIQRGRGAARHAGRVPPLRQGDRLLPPGEVGRQRLPRRRWPATPSRSRRA